MMTVFTRKLASLCAAALIGFTAHATLAPGSLAQAGGDFAGNVTDTVTGMRCVTPSCDTLVTQDNSCICQKNNPNAMTLADLSLTCTTGPANGSRVCTPAGMKN